MLEPNDNYFVQLIVRLAQPPALPDAFTQSPDTHASRTAILKALYRLPSTDAVKFLSVLNSEGLPNESSSSLLSRAHEIAKAMLPRLLREYQLQLDKEAAQTEHDRFLKNESEYDPFVEGTNFTRDSYAGRGELEADPPTVVDAWGNVSR